MKIRRTLPKNWRDQLAKVKFIQGGTSERDFERDHGLCIMEFVSLLMGRRWGDRPPCVAESITEVLIQINDHLRSGQARRKLAEVVPEIVGTCPIVAPQLEGAFVRRDATPTYQRREVKRLDLVRKWLAALKPGERSVTDALNEPYYGDYGDYDDYELADAVGAARVTIARKLDLVRQMAAVK